MTWSPNLHCWLMLALCWTAVYGLSDSPAAAEAEVATRGNVKVMFMFKEVGAEGIQTVETILAQAFTQYGYSVMDREMVAQTLHREADVLQLYKSEKKSEIETAKFLSRRLGATIIVNGKSQVSVQERSFDMLGGKKVLVSQADVSAQAILPRFGTVLVSTEESAKAANDMTGHNALKKAAESLARKLIE